MKFKKAQSNIITVVLIILLVLSVIIIYWNFSITMVQKTSSGINIEQFLFNGKINPFLTNNGEILKIEVNRGSGEKAIKGIKLIFEEDAKTYFKEIYSDLPDNLETKTYFISKQDLNANELVKIKKANLYFIFESKGKDELSQRLDSKAIQKISSDGNCDYGVWTDVGCNQAGCSGKMHQTRTVTGTGCSQTSRCDNRDYCVSPECIGTLQGGCSDLNQDSCSMANEKCTWFDSITCTGFYDCAYVEDECYSNPFSKYCSVSQEGCYGNLDCSIYNEQECASRSNYCSWDGFDEDYSCFNNIYNPVQCSSIMNTNICNSLNGCSWQPTHCSGSGNCNLISSGDCGSVSTVIGCNYNAVGCNNNENGNGITQCQQLPASICTQVQGCRLP